MNLRLEARGLEARNTRLEGSRLEGSRLEGSRLEGSEIRNTLKNIFSIDYLDKAIQLHDEEFVSAWGSLHKTFHQGLLLCYEFSNNGNFFWPIQCITLFIIQV